MPSSASSFNSNFSSSSSLIGKLTKYQLKRKFYEKLEDFHQRVLLYKEPGFVVYRAKCVYSGGIVVLKGYARQALTPQTQQTIWSEVNTLQNAHCPFILKCFDSFEDQGWWFLVLENCAAGDLYRIMQAQGRISTEGWLVSQVLLPLLQTLGYLHNEGIIHRDIKPEHVLFNSEKVAKLSGFFLAQDVTKFGYPKDMVGNLDYVAPEVFKLSTPEHKALAKTGTVSSTYDFKVDIWMTGILTYDVLVGVPPFSSESPSDTVQRVLLEDPVFPEDVSDSAADFVLCCLTKDPALRPTARQLLSHPWVRAHITWVPPLDFEDPVPDMDFAYYEPEERLGGMAQQSDSDSDEGTDLVRRVWYNPATWFRKKAVDDLDQELEMEGTNARDLSALTMAQKVLQDGGVATTDSNQPNQPNDAPCDQKRPASSSSMRLGTMHSIRRVESGRPGSGIGSARGNKVAPSTPPAMHALLGEAGDQDDDEGLIPVPDLTPRSDAPSDDGPAPAPGRQRISEHQRRAGPPIAMTSAVPPVSISNPSHTNTNACAGKDQNGSGDGTSKQSSVPALTGIAALAGMVNGRDAGTGQGMWAEGGSVAGTPRSARSGRLEPLQHAALAPVLAPTQPPQAFPGAGAGLGMGTEAGPGPVAGVQTRAAVPLVPPLPLAAVGPSPDQRKSLDDVIKLSARDGPSALYSGRPPADGPPTHRSDCPSASHASRTYSNNVLEQLAPPGYKDGNKTLATAPPPSPAPDAAELSSGGPSSPVQGSPVPVQGSLPLVQGLSSPAQGVQGSLLVSHETSVLLTKSPTGHMLALETGPSVLTRPGSRMAPSRTGTPLPGERQPVPPTKPPTPPLGPPSQRQESLSTSQTESSTP